MKNTFLALIALVAFASMAHAQFGPPSSATATANARILCPLSITHDYPSNQNELNFGCLINNGGGTAHVNNGPSGSVATTGGLYAYTGTNAGCNSNLPTAAVFTLCGESGFSYNVKIPDVSTAGYSIDFTYNNGGGGFDYLNDPGAIAGINDNIGGEGGCYCAPVHVGGTLSVNAGFYGTITAPFTVTVQYN